MIGLSRGGAFWVVILLSCLRQTEFAHECFAPTVLAQLLIANGFYCHIKGRLFHSSNFLLLSILCEGLSTDVLIDQVPGCWLVNDQFRHQLALQRSIQPPDFGQS